MDAKKVVEQATGPARGAIRRAERAGRVTGSFLAGKASAVVNRSREPKDLNDQDLKAKVESVVFRPADAPKDSVSISVAHGVVELRGVVKRPEDKKKLEAEVRKLPEVGDVKNLLHLPKTPAPGRADSPGRQKRRS